MKLLNNEIRDIQKLLEEGKPLPEKYRFLLFEDKQNLELVWNGKTGGVTNIVLPFQTIETVDEPRAGKPRVKKPETTYQQLSGKASKRFAISKKPSKSEKGKSANKTSDLFCKDIMRVKKVKI